MKKQQVIKPQIVKEEKNRHYHHRLLEKEEVLATFQGYIYEPNKYITLDKVEGDVNAINTLGEDFFNMCQARNLNVIVNNLPDIPERKEIVDLMFEYGFKLKSRLVHYSLDLKEFEYKPVETLPFVFKSMDTLDEEFFKNLLFSSTDGDPLMGELSPNNPDDFLEDTKDYPTFNPSHWILVYLETQPVGFILANINPNYAPDVVAGCIEYFSILPGFRKQGFGAQLHYYAMSYLKELGAVVYHGNTSTKNKGMIRLFKKSGCKMAAEASFFETKEI